MAASTFTNSFLKELSRQKIEYTLTPFVEEVFTTRRVAGIANIAEEAIGKAMLVAVGKEHATALLPGQNRLDLQALKKIVQQKVYILSISRVEKVTGLEIGAVTPLVALEKPDLRVYGDRSLLRFDTINISTGHRQWGMNINPRALFDVVKAEEVDISVKLDFEEQ